MSTAWNEEAARAWLSGKMFGLPMTMRAMKSGIDWLTPQPLPSRYQHRQSNAHECLSDAVATAEEFPELIVAVGYSFRPESQEGISHVFNLGGDLYSFPVDLAAGRLGPPVGYLYAIPDDDTLARLAGLNGLSISDNLLDRHAVVAPAIGQVAPPAKRDRHPPRAALK